MESDEINLLIFSCSILVRLSVVTTGRLEGPLSTTTIKLQAKYPTHWRTNTGDLLQIENSVLFSVHDHRSETFVARIEYSEIFDGK